MRRTRVNQETPYGAVRMAVIDISLNSVKLLIATKQMNTKIDFDKDESVINLLSKVLKNKGVIEGEYLTKLLFCLDEFLATALKYCEPRFTKIISTEVLSQVKNKTEILTEIEKLWYKKVETALNDRIKLWEKEILKPKKAEPKPGSTKDPDKAKKEYGKFRKYIKDLYNISLEDFLDNKKLVEEFVFEHYKPEIITYDPKEAEEIFFDLILNDIQKSAAKKFFHNATVVDLTGEELSIIKCEKGKIANKVSLPIGILSYTEKYIKEGNIERKSIPAIIKPANDFFAGSEIDKIDNLVFIGGNAINLARICREVPINRSNDVHGYEIMKKNLNTLLEGLCALSYKKRNTLIGLQEGRQNSILSACIIYLKFMEKVNVEKAVLSTYGLRHKVIIDLLNKNFEQEKKKRELEDFKNKYPDLFTDNDTMLISN